MSESDINVFAIAPVDADAWLDRLPAHERHSALTIRDLTARARFVSGRVGLRALLSERTGCRAADIGLEIATTGAVSSPAKDWVFSISHADALSVIALARRSPVGVDIEVLRQVDDALLIASHHMHAAEQEWLREFPYPTLSFASCVYGFARRRS